MSLPKCPKCGSEYTYEDGSMLVCPECFYEWTLEDNSANEENVVKDANGNIKWNDTSFKYNKNNPKKEIKSYFCKINESQKQALATGILIKINEKNYKNLDEDKIIELFLNQVKVIKKLLKNFYIVSAALYFEKSLTLRIIGIPYVKDKENELEVRVSKSNCFRREKVEELRLHLQIQANKDFLKFFVTKTKVIVTKNNIDIKQLKLFENYRENRV